MMRMWAVIALLHVPALAFAGPCATGTADCTEWIALGHGPARSLIYRTAALDVRNERIRRALIVVHDTTRDAPSYFQTAVAAAFLAGALDDTIVIAPRLASNNGTCADNLTTGEINWPCEGNSWRSGGIAIGVAQTSFDLMDEILRKVARKTVFPNLSAIVVSGHSAGGQFVTRYEMVNRIHDTLGVPISYVVANPSSYAYPDATRPVHANGTVGFAPFRDRSCAAFDRWPYGLLDRTGYAVGFTAAQLKKQLAERPTTYLLGELDVLPNAVFDASCAAMAQGPTRLARGQAFVAYVNQNLRAHHTATVVPLCGHSARCMFTADVALPALFPRVQEP